MRLFTTNWTKGWFLDMFLATSFHRVISEIYFLNVLNFIILTGKRNAHKLIGTRESFTTAKKNLRNLFSFVWQMVSVAIFCEWSEKWNCMLNVSGARVYRPHADVLIYKQRQEPPGNVLKQNVMINSLRGSYTWIILKMNDVKREIKRKKGKTPVGFYLYKLKNKLYHDQIIIFLILFYHSFSLHTNLKNGFFYKPKMAFFDCIFKKPHGKREW